MAIDANTIKMSVDRELDQVSDVRILSHVRALRVEPKEVLRKWDYGRPEEKYICWSVLEHYKSNTSIAHCENGFGPKCPWGLVCLKGSDQEMSMGMDSGWFPTFLEAYFESFASADLPIWRVIKTDTSGSRHPITRENTWEETWERISELRKADPKSRYDCDHIIEFKYFSDS